MKLLVLVDIGEDLICPAWMPKDAILCAVPDNEGAEVFNVRLHDAANSIADHLASPAYLMREKINVSPE